MHVELTIRTNDKLFTIMYDGVVRVRQLNNNVQVCLNEDYALKCINKYWYEYNASTTPYIHIYNGGVVEQLFISEV